ncbi:BatD family protein [Parasediminibacterium paludis]|uniref:BatD family protein n=1 Tax=Parasediminibacterium paludis TaxID=908966 RepID=A0ABV8Q1K9_9BACT
MRKLSFRFQVSRHKVYVEYMCLVVCSLFSLQTVAQKVTTTTNKSTIRIGEQFELKLTIEPAANSTVLLDTWFNLPDSFNHFEVLQRLPIDTIEVGGAQSFAQKILITSYDTGTFKLPEFAVKLIGNKMLTSLPLPIKVLPVNISNMQDYNDIKEIIEVAPETDWWLWGKIGFGILLLIVVVIFVVKYYLGKRPSKPIKKIAISVNDVLQQIEALQPLITSQQYKLFFTSLITITRNFSDVQLGITSLSKTTDEYMVLLKGKVGNAPTQVQYYQLLRLADAVKFAKYQPATTECEQAIQAAKTFVTTIHSFNYQPKANAV